MAQGVAGTCIICDLPLEKRHEVEARIIRGDTFDTVAQLADTSLPMPKRHMELHMPPETPRLRAWMSTNAASPSKAIEATRTKMLAEAPATVTAEDISRRFLALERYAFRILAQLESSEDFRGSIQAVEALRRLTDSLATVNGVKSMDSKEAVDSVDVEALRFGILDLVRQKAPGAISR